MKNAQDMPNRDMLAIEVMAAGLRLKVAQCVTIAIAGDLKATARSMESLQLKGQSIPELMIDELDQRTSRLQAAVDDLSDAVRSYDSAVARLQETYLRNRIKRYLRNWYWQT